MKSKYFVISIILTVVIFFALVYVEKKVAGVDRSVSALIVKQNVNVNKFDKLEPSMFEVKKVPVFLGEKVVSDIKEIDSKYALYSLSSGDILKEDRIGSKSQVPILQVDSAKRKIAISVSSLADAVAGQIRKDSFVDILFTNSPTTDDAVVKTETIFEKVRVIGVTDSNGSLIDDASDRQIGAVLLEVTPQEAHILANKERKGKFRLIGVPDNGQVYDKITVR